MPAPTRQPVVIDLPAGEEPDPEPTLPTRDGRRRIGEDGRRLLREGLAAIGLDSVKGNALADWLDKHPNAVVTITGKTPEPPLRVFGTPDVAPEVNRRQPGE